jgi:hypothetical protein
MTLLSVASVRAQKLDARNELEQLVYDIKEAVSELPPNKNDPDTVPRIERLAQDILTWLQEETDVSTCTLDEIVDRKRRLVRALPARAPTRTRCR